MWLALNILQRNVQHPWSDQKTYNIGGRRIQTLKKIGEGGFSVVYLAKDRDSGEEFAVKKLLVQDPAQKRRAMQEVEIFERFKHKNILRMLAYTVVDSESSYGAQEYLLLLEYYSKGSLQDLIERMKKFSFSLKEDEILKMFVQICDALRLFHENNPVLKHNDIKPHNVLLTPDNTPILMDFGSVEAARITAKNRAETLAMLEDASETSTPVYRAPELFDIDPHMEDLSIDEAVDVWALGCVLYAMAYHDNPFELAVSRGGSLRLAVNNVRLDFPDDNQYSKQFMDLIKWILNPNPKERPNITQVIARTNDLLENLQ